MNEICCCSSSSVLHTNRVFRVDPTRTTVLRKQYERDMVKRFRWLRRLIQELIIDDDVLGVAEPDLTKVNPLQAFVARPPRQAWRGRTSSEKVEQFMNWLKKAEREGILETTIGTAFGRSRWQNVYLQSAYQKGLASAAGRLKRKGAKVQDSFIEGSFFRPIHADRIGLIYTRAFSDLEGITAAMDAQISRTLAQGLAEGRGVRDIANSVIDRVDRIGITRARTLTRTEIVGANAEGALNTYMEAGIEGVEVEAEFMTTRDNRVCPRCRELEGGVRSIDDARGVIPVHPNCRCAWIPVVAQDIRGIVLA